MNEMFITIAAVGLGGLIVGSGLGAWVTNRRLRLRIEEIGSEVIELRSVAEEKLGDDDPNLPDLLQDLNEAVDQATSAIDALGAQSALTRKKSEGARQIISATKNIVAMMEDLGADMPMIPASRAQALTAPRAPGAKKTPEIS